MMSMKLFRVLIIISIIDRIINGISIINRISESEAITLLENVDLSEKKKKKKIIIKCKTFLSCIKDELSSYRVR